MNATKPEPVIDHLAPLFLVADFDGAIEFYRDKLGFQLEFVFDGFYAAVKRGGAVIHLKHSDEPDPTHEFKRRHEHLDVYVRVTGIDGLYAELKARGVVFAGPLADTPWGTREFVVADLDGYILYFGEPKPAGTGDPPSQ